jgi:hypothetical protein
MERRLDRRRLPLTTSLGEPPGDRAPHWITISALSSNAFGTVTPIASRSG